MLSKNNRANILANIPLIFLLSFPSISNSQTVQDEKLCLAKTIYHEARGEPESGKRAIAKVILSRTEHKAFPKTICKVVNQIMVIDKKKICQFSWVCSKAIIDKTSDSWETSLKLSKEIIDKQISLPKFNSDVLFFKSKQCRYNFGKGYRLVATIGNTKFYEKKIT